MKPLNTFPIEDFLEKSRIARKSSQKTLTLTAKEYSDLSDSLSMVMTRIANTSESADLLDDTVTIKMDGGKF
jgi:hypothetical protein